MPRARGDKGRAPKSKAKKSQSRRSYHHGNLREALVQTTLQLIEKGGLDQVTVRDAAKRVGVSNAAPFRHFPNRAALLTAVAEEAQSRFRAEMMAAIASVKDDDPIARFRAIGLAYVRWALRNPNHFEIISTSRFALENSLAHSEYREELIQYGGKLLEEAKRRGMLDGDPRIVLLAGRAVVYGLASLALDGHLPRWGIEKIAEEVIDFYMAHYVESKTYLQARAREQAERDAKKRGEAKKKQREQTSK